jgi:nucleosome binding factor SPN SPT16 subunit
MYVCHIQLVALLLRAAAFADPVQFWLLGYEFPTTMMLFTLDTLYILTTAKKGEQVPCLFSHPSLLTVH